MNNIERQILENQLFIMECLDLAQDSKDERYNMTEPLTKTQRLLNPTNQNESACDMSDLDRMDAEDCVFGGVGEK